LLTLYFMIFYKYLWLHLTVIYLYLHITPIQVKQNNTSKLINYNAFKIEQNTYTQTIQDGFIYICYIVDSFKLLISTVWTFLTRPGVLSSNDFQLGTFLTRPGLLSSNDFQLWTFFYRTLVLSSNDSNCELFRLT
jgi:hypothetical protein